MCETDARSYRARHQHLSDENILAVLDGTASDYLRTQLAHCPSCAARAEELMSFEHQLRYCLYRALCPTTDELLAYVQRKLNPESFIRITEHIFDCQECAKELQILEQAANIPTHIELLDMQPKHYTAAQSSTTSRHRARMNLGLRCGNREVQYVYHASNMSLSLSISPGHSSMERCLSGFLIIKAHQEPGIHEGWVSLIHDGRVLHRSLIDRSGCFKMHDLILGRHVLSLQTDQCEIVIDPLDI